MDFSGTTANRLRSFGRRLGVFPPLVRAWRTLSGANYEQRFDTQLLDELRPGDTVWDVGANVGLYTRKFLARVAPAGRVVAFEPSPQNLPTLRAIEADSQLRIVAAALSDQPGTTLFYSNPGDNGTTDSLAARSEQSVPYTVHVHRGDEYLDDCAPDVIKIDVEGFELEVLRGLPRALESPRLRAIFIEVHFGILSDRGMPEAPSLLVQLLKHAGFIVTWIDPSHLVGRRPALRPK